MQAAAASGDSAEYESAELERGQLLYEFAGTRTGQKELAARIAAETNPAKQRYLQDYTADARRSYENKVQRLRAHEAAPPTTARPAAPASASRVSASSYSVKGGKGAPLPISMTPAATEDDDCACGEPDVYDGWAECPVHPSGDKPRAATSPANSATAPRVSASSYTGKGGKNAAPSTPRPAPSRPASSRPAATPSLPPAPARRVSASSYTGKGGK